MRRHVHMNLWAAPADDYYPLANNTATFMFGASTDINDWTFGDGAGGIDGERYAVIRALIAGPTTVSAAPFPIVELKDAAGNVVQSWTINNTESNDMLCGPDGFVIPEGFYITTTNASSYVTIVYDVA